MPNTTFQLKKDLNHWRFRAEEKEEAAAYYERELRRYKLALALAVVGIVAMIMINLL